MYLRQFFESQGLAKGTARLINMIHEKKIRPHDISLLALWESMGRPALRQNQRVLERIENPDDPKELQEAGTHDSSFFPKLTGAIVNDMVMEAYREEMGVGDQLVTTVPSKLKDETIVGFTSTGEPQEVPEGQNYESTQFGEKNHKILNKKFGKLIILTEEMVRFDQTGQLLQGARDAGQAIAAKREEEILKCVIEATPGESWRPDGVNTTLYSNTSADPFSAPATYDNLVTDALNDETDVVAALTLFGQAKNEDGRPIIVDPEAILSSVALLPNNQKIFGSTGSVIVKAGGTGASANVAAHEGIENPFRGLFAPLASAWVDQTLDANHWFIGDFKKQFVWTEVFPVEIFQARPGNDMEFKADLVWAWKCRFMGGCGAVTNRFVVKSSGST